jgi:hypothetical protein
VLPVSLVVAAPGQMEAVGDENVGVRLCKGRRQNRSLTDSFLSVISCSTEALGQQMHGESREDRDSDFRSGSCCERDELLCRIRYS